MVLQSLRTKSKLFDIRVTPVSHDFDEYRASSDSVVYLTGIMRLVTTETAPSKQTGFAWALIISGLVGLAAAFALTYEKFYLLLHPGSSASCDLSIVVQCGKNLASWQGALLGFPNPILGLIAWPVVIATGVGLLAGATYARWYWRAFHITAMLGFVFVIWLFTESVFDLGTLCPWCMVTWVATITLVVVSKGWVLKHGMWGQSDWLKNAGARILQWAPSIILAIIVIEAIIAQVRLDWINHL
jgi:uncharacterized membrane protein